jgi:hypothetical protein
MVTNRLVGNIPTKSKNNALTPVLTVIISPARKHGRPLTTDRMI